MSTNESLIEQAINDPESFFKENHHLRDDRDFMTKLVMKEGSLFNFASSKLRNDKMFVLFAVSQNRELSLSDLYIEDFNAYGDREIVDVCVGKGDRSVLNHPMCPFNNDKNIMLRAVISNGMALEYGSKDIRDDREIVRCAIKSNPVAIAYASKKLNEDKALQSMSQELLDDRDTILNAMRTYPETLYYASERIKDDKGVIFNAVKIDGSLLEYASERLKRDPDVIMAAVKNDIHALDYVSQELKKHKVFWVFLGDKIPEVLDMMPDNIQNKENNQPGGR